MDDYEMPACDNCGEYPGHAVAEEIERLRAALRAIAGTAPWPDSEMGFNDLARSALSPKEPE